jgi:hypothetical protein
LCTGNLVDSDLIAKQADDFWSGVEIWAAEKDICIYGTLDDLLYEWTHF